VLGPADHEVEGQRRDKLSGEVMRMSLKSGDRVRVISGPYKGWEAEVLRVEGDPQRVTVVITVFGRSAAIELRPSQIEPYYDGGTSRARQWDSPSDPDAPVRHPRRSGPSGRNSTISLVEPEAEQPADAIAGIVHDLSKLAREALKELRAGRTTDL
jgi:hypothetical protein